jgi:hypothetical protein
LKYWFELDDNLCTSIDWWNIYRDNLGFNFDGTNNLKLFSIKAEKIFNPENDSEFFTIACEVLKRMCTNDLTEYKLYWYTGIKTNSLQPRVSQYKKVWKELKSKWNLESFILGPEINVMYHNTDYYVGIAEFNKEVFTNNILFKNLLINGVVFASKRKSIMSEDFLKEFSLHAHSLSETRGFYNFDYINLIKYLSLDNDIVVVYENNYESSKVCLTFREEMSKVFEAYVKNV